MSIKAVKTLLACLFAVLAAPAIAITEPTGSRTSSIRSSG
jgi:hypothetical protein